MNVIMLDIDGVLNSVNSTVAFNALGFSREHPSRLDLCAIGLLKRLCDKTDAKIVISSTWRIGRTVEDMIEIFKGYGWDAPIIDMTGRGGVGSCRGDEIKEWLDSQTNVHNYVILDDDSDMLESQSDHFVHCMNLYGFRAHELCIALNILGHRDKDLEEYVDFYD